MVIREIHLHGSDFARMIEVNLLRVSSRIGASDVAAEVTRRKRFLVRTPPPYVGGYYS